MVKILSWVLGIVAGVISIVVVSYVDDLLARFFLAFIITGLLLIYAEYLWRNV